MVRWRVITNDSYATADHYYYCISFVTLSFFLPFRGDLQGVFVIEFHTKSLTLPGAILDGAKVFSLPLPLVQH